MTSDKIQALGFDGSGTLRGKDSLRAYWGKALALLPNLRFELIDIFVSPDSVAVLYTNEHRKNLRISAARCGGQDFTGLGEPSGALGRDLFSMGYEFFNDPFSRHGIAQRRSRNAGSSADRSTSIRPSGGSIS